MKNFTRIVLSVSLMLMAFTAYSQDVFKTANVGIGTTSPAQKLEIAGTTNTIRIGGLKAGGSYNPLTSAANSNSNFIYVNNSTGDIGALASGSAGSILTISATGVPTWSTSATALTAWQLSGNSITAPTAPSTYGTSAIGSGSWMGTTDGDDIVFGTNDIERMRIGGGSTATAAYVGIGTATPASVLHVVELGNQASGDFGGGSGYNTALEIENKSGTMPIIYINGSTANNALAGIIERANTTAFYSGLNNSANYRIAGITSIAGSAVSGAKDGTAGITVLESNGNVGLNYITPANPLDISGAEAIGSYAGTAAPSNGLIVSGITGIGTSAPVDQLHVVETGNQASSVDFGGSTGYNTALEIENRSGTMPILYINGSTANNPLAGIIERANTTAFYTGLNNSANYRIAAITSIAGSAVSTAKDGTAGITVLESNGNVGLNYITPANALDINGAEAIGYAGTAAPSNGLIVSGNTGIGTNAPATTLHVVQTGNHTSDFTGYNVAVQIENPGGTMPILYIKGSTSNNANLAAVVLEGSSTSFYTGLNNSANYRIGGFSGFGTLGTSGKDGTSGITVLNSNGNVGIGVIAPAQALQVLGSVQFSQALMPNGAAGSSGNILLSAGAATAPTWLSNGTSGQVLTANGSGIPTWTTSLASIGVTAPIVNTGTATAPVIGIQGVAANKGGILYSTGSGTSAAFNSTGTTGNILLSAGTGVPTWLADGSSGQTLTANGSGIPTWTTSASAWQINGNSNTTSTTNFIGTTNSQDVVFEASNTEDMRIANSTGYVGIGTASPASELHVVESGNQASGDFGGGSGYNTALEIENKGGTMPILYINGSTANNPIGGIVERASTTAFYSGMNNSADYRMAGIAGIDGGDLTTAKDGSEGITVMSAHGASTDGFVGIGQSSPQTVLDMYYGGGDGTGNAGITIENGSMGNFRLWVSDYNNSEDDGDGGFNIWNNNYGGDNFTIDVNSGNVGLGGNWQDYDPQAAASVMGNEIIGADFVYNYNGAPGNGLIVEGQTSIGTPNNTNMLDVSGSQAIGSYAGSNSAPSNGLIVSGSVGLGTSSPANELDVAGGVAAGTYAGTAAPSDGLIVSGQVGVGTSTPNAGAALDVTSSTQGMLIPRMASAPTSPATSMIYYNTTSGCFMFYTGSAWQSIVCTCADMPAAAGTISGSTTFCPLQTGVTYTVGTINGATGYAWSIPADATITAGWGSPSITVTFGNDAGAISVAGTNTCGTGTSSSLTVTSSGAAITSQPVNAAADCASPGTVTFSVTATGASLTYQWDVSTNGGSTWTALTNVAPYSNVTTATLSITSPTTGMNGYQYRCVVTTTACGGSSVTSSAATLTTGLSSVPITLTNTVSGTTTLANLTVQLIINFSGYTSGSGDAAGVLNTSLNNVEFTTGGGGSGTPLYAWIENGNSLSATATSASSSSTHAVVWVNLGSTTITNGTPKIIYMNFTGSNVMTGATGYTGEAAEITGTYGQYDNGAKVFSLYDDFTSSTSSLFTNNWSSPEVVGSCTETVSNGITFNSGNGSGASGSAPYVYAISSKNTFAPPIMAELYMTSGALGVGSVRSLEPGLTGYSVTSAPDPGSIGDMYYSNTGSNNPNPYLCWDDAQNGGYTWDVWAQQGNPTSGSEYPYSMGTPSGYNILGVYYNGTSSGNAWWYNYTNEHTSTNGTTYSPSGSLYFSIGIDNAGSGGGVASFSAYWARVRVAPPSNTLPSVTYGSFGCN